MDSAITDKYPRVHQLEDGAKVTWSLMTSDDLSNLSKFLNRLPAKDLAYLQVDITDAVVQQMWLQSIAEGKSICLCAYDPASLVGYASVQVSGDQEQRKGEIRVNISQGYRSRGLGRILIGEILDISKMLHLSLLTARMLSDQHGARAAFGRLGFSRQALLEGYVDDPSLDCRDLLVMSSNL